MISVIIKIAGPGAVLAAGLAFVAPSKQPNIAPVDLLERLDQRQARATPV